MKMGLTYRLFLSILGATCLAILALFLIMRWSVDREFYRYLGTVDQARLEQIASELGRRYEEQGSWNFLGMEAPRWDVGGLMVPSDHEAARMPDVEGETPGRGQRPFGPQSLHRRGAGRLIVLDAGRNPVLGSYPNDEEVNFRPVIARGENVGFVGFLSPKHFLHPMQVRFLTQQRLALSLAAAGMVLVVMIISLPLARRLVKPVKAMAAATHEIASGRYATRIPVTSSDELGMLARDFNDMALTLDKHEKERRQWVADISHELRTPIAVLQGEIEALLDGIRKVTPETVRSLHAEVLRLNRLVEDLYHLSLSDIGALTYRKEDLDLAGALSSSLEAYSAEFGHKGIAVTANISEKKVIVFADPERLAQLFTNLFENSLRYTDAGGALAVNLVSAEDHVVIEIQDSNPGVSAEDLEKLFERLFRVEGSRNRTSGGAGLGLAICKNIVEAHEGTISAHHSPLGGLLIRVTLPVAGGGHG
jgi:two-component system, OmpR family, sensor histidine kinase BaeS